MQILLFCPGRNHTGSRDDEPQVFRFSHFQAMARFLHNTQVCLGWQVFSGLQNSFLEIDHDVVRIDWGNTVSFRGYSGC